MFVVVNPFISVFMGVSNYLLINSLIIFTYLFSLNINSVYGY